MRIVEQIRIWRSKLSACDVEISRRKDRDRELLRHPAVIEFFDNRRRMAVLPEVREDISVELERRRLLLRRRQDLCAMVDCGAITFEFAMVIYQQDLMPPIEDSPAVMGSWQRHPIP